MGVTQEEKNLGMILHGLVALTGVALVIPFLSVFGVLAPIASVVLYFVWKSKSPWVVRHAKQAAGMQVCLFLVGILIGIVGAVSFFLSLLAGSFGAPLVTGSLIGLLTLAAGVFAVVVGIMGLLKAEKGEEYTYPIVGRWVDGLNI